MIDYLINPVKMSGVVKDVYDGGNMVKIYLRGRLGVIKVPRWMIKGDTELVPGHELEFYFSYIQVIADPYDYSGEEMKTQTELEPLLLGGKIIDVNDTAGTVKVIDDLGVITVPRRWFITAVELKPGCETEFYLSRMEVTGRKDLPAQFI